MCIGMASNILLLLYGQMYADLVTDQMWQHKYLCSYGNGDCILKWHAGKKTGVEAEMKGFMIN